MTVIVISLIGGWIVFSAILVTIICMNSSRLSRIDEPFKDPAELAQERRDRRPPISEDYSEDECEECGEWTLVSSLRRNAGMCQECYAKYRSTA